MSIIPLNRSEVEYMRICKERDDLRDAALQLLAEYERAPDVMETLARLNEAYAASTARLQEAERALREARQQFWTFIYDKERGEYSGHTQATKVADAVVEFIDDAIAALREGGCPDCGRAARRANSDATTPGFHHVKCERHRAEPVLREGAGGGDAPPFEARIEEIIQKRMAEFDARAEERGEEGACSTT